MDIPIESLCINRRATNILKNNGYTLFEQIIHAYNKDNLVFLRLPGLGIKTHNELIWALTEGKDELIKDFLFWKELAEERKAHIEDINKIQTIISDRIGNVSRCLHTNKKLNGQCKNPSVVLNNKKVDYCINHLDDLVKDNHGGL